MLFTQSTLTTILFAALATISLTCAATAPTPKTVKCQPTTEDARKNYFGSWNIMGPMTSQPTNPHPASLIDDQTTSYKVTLLNDPRFERKISSEYTAPFNSIKLFDSYTGAGDDGKPRGLGTVFVKIVFKYYAENGWGKAATSQVYLFPETFAQVKTCVLDDIPKGVHHYTLEAWIQTPKK